MRGREQRTHLRGIAVPEPAQQVGRRRGGRISAELWVPGLLAGLFHQHEGVPAGIAAAGQLRQRDRFRDEDRANRNSPTGSGEPTRYGANARARSMSTSRVGPSTHRTRHAGRSHSTVTGTAASSDSSNAHRRAPSHCATHRTPPAVTKSRPGVTQ